MNVPSPLPPGQDLTGRELAGYSVLRKLGAGGMADVYLAEQRSLGRQVALKVLHDQLAHDASYVERFIHEARSAASLVHPNIVQIYEVGHAENIHFIAQEYVAGKNLGQLLERQGSLEPGLVLDILRQVTSALCKSHELGIIHRDIKPENILLSHTGAVKVADFGLARVNSADKKTLTQVGVTMGTPLYMSPEQIEGRPLDIRSDIYSLGVTCYHLLGGQPPHNGDTALAIAMQHLNSVPIPLENVRRGLPSSLARIVHQMLAKKPENRPASPGELLTALRELATAAAQQGWAEGPDNWSLVDLVAADEGRSQANQRLGDLMKAETKLRKSGPSWARLALVLVLAALAGAAVARATRPRPYLAGSQSPPVPTRASAGAQLYHAKMTDTPAAWQKVWIEFPDADPFLRQLAKQGLVRHYLLVSQDYDLAAPVLRELDEFTPSDELRAFVFASRTIVNQQLGRPEEARRAQEQLTPEYLDYLERNEGSLYDLLQTSLRQLGEQGAGASD